MAAWPLFGVAFIRRGGAPRGQSQTREPAAWAGIALQAVAFACIWSFRRDPAGALMFPDRPALSAAIAVASVLLAWACAGMVFWAIRTLGRQWAVSASLVEGHELVTTGPYRFVRNPIYAGLFGMAMATAGVYSRPWTIVVGAPLFLAGDAGARARGGAAPARAVRRALRRFRPARARAPAEAEAMTMKPRERSMETERGRISLDRRGRGMAASSCCTRFRCRPTCGAPQARQPARRAGA